MTSFPVFFWFVWNGKGEERWRGGKGEDTWSVKYESIKIEIVVHMEQEIELKASKWNFKSKHKFLYLEG